jgi:1,4-dihydroxy-2-naphthoyl-CoA hydrolase
MRGSIRAAVRRLKNVVALDSRGPYAARMPPLFSARRTVLFQEIDAAGIVFYARFFDWFHDAYAACLDERGVGFKKVLADQAWGLPLAHAEADYRSPLAYATPIRVDVETVVLGETSATVTYAVRSDDGKTVHATGKTVHVFIDRKTFKPRPVPAEVKSAFALP